jgi:hypothetical protein
MSKRSKQVAQQESSGTQDVPQQKRSDDVQQSPPKAESTAEFEGAETRKPTGNPGSEVKTETSSSSGQ